MCGRSPDIWKSAQVQIFVRPRGWVMHHPTLEWNKVGKSRCSGCSWCRQSGADASPGGSSSWRIWTPGDTWKQARPLPGSHQFLLSTSPDFDPRHPRRWNGTSRIWRSYTSPEWQDPTWQVEGTRDQVGQQLARADRRWPRPLSFPSPPV